MFPPLAVGFETVGGRDETGDRARRKEKEDIMDRISFG